MALEHGSDDYYIFDQLANKIYCARFYLSSSDWADTFVSADLADIAHTIADMMRFKYGADDSNVNSLIEWYHL